MTFSYFECSNCGCLSLEPNCLGFCHFFLCGLSGIISIHRFLSACTECVPFRSPRHWGSDGLMALGAAPEIQAHIHTEAICSPTGSTEKGLRTEGLQKQVYFWGYNIPLESTVWSAHPTVCNILWFTNMLNSSLSIFLPFLLSHSQTCNCGLHSSPAFTDHFHRAFPVMQFIILICLLMCILLLRDS